MKVGGMLIKTSLIWRCLISSETGKKSVYFSVTNQHECPCMGHGAFVFGKLYINVLHFEAHVMLSWNHVPMKLWVVCKKVSRD